MVNTFQTRKVKSAFTLIEIMIVVLIIGILLAIAVPNFVRARESSRAKACIANLKAIDGAVQQLAMQSNIPGGASFTGLAVEALVDANFLKSVPVCPSGGTYTITGADTSPTCSTSTTGGPGDPFGHVLP